MLRLIRIRVIMSRPIIIIMRIIIFIVSSIEFVFWDGPGKDFAWGRLVFAISLL